MIIRKYFTRYFYAVGRDEIVLRITLYSLKYNLVKNFDIDMFENDIIDNLCKELYFINHIVTSV